MHAIFQALIIAKKIQTAKRESALCLLIQAIRIETFVYIVRFQIACDGVGFINVVVIIACHVSFSILKYDVYM